MTDQQFTEEQQQYLKGFAAGSGLGQVATPGIVPVASPAKEVAIGPDALQRAAQDRCVAAGKKLVPEEQAKRDKNAIDFWDQIERNANEGRFPKGTDVFLYKFRGLFHVAPAQNSFMCRLRFPAGVVSAHQFRGIAELSEKLAGGTADVTTRSNLQIREIGPKNTIDLLTGLADLGVVNRGAGADNIRNITASPTAGIDPQELIDTRGLARQMHHYILNHREMYGLPRKFNIAFDGGGTISTLEDTNDIGFVAVRVKPGALATQSQGGVYLRMQLGGITGHRDFARDCGVLLEPDECVRVAAAVVRVFLENGDRSNRARARLKYVLDDWGLDKFLAEVERHLSGKLRRLPLDQCEAGDRAVDRLAHVGFHPQKQPGRVYVGVVLPVGRMTAAQMRILADIAQRFGSGDLRLTVWQNLLIPDIRLEDTEQVKKLIENAGLHWSATNVRAGLVACTGSAGCKYAAANTKAHALQIADHLDSRVRLDRPINVHLTGCHHSCAQHYVGDVGLLATKIAVGEDMVEGYHVFVGGGYGAQQQIGREMYRDVTAADAGPLIERMLRRYLELRHENEGFQDFVKRQSDEQLKKLFNFEPQSQDVHS